ncbi:hypothetical protein PWG68_15500 [Chromobacterium amazonense]
MPPAHGEWGRWRLSPQGQQVEWGLALKEPSGEVVYGVLSILFFTGRVAPLMIGGACLLLLLGLELGDFGFQFRNLLLELFRQFLLLLFADSAVRLPSVLQALQLFSQLLQLLFQAGDLAVDV